MTAVLIQPDGKKQQTEGDDAEHDAEHVLREAGTEGPVVHMQMQDETAVFSVWMGVDPAMPVNTSARKAIVDLAGLHIMCFGPVLIVGLDEDTATEVVGL